MGLLSKASAALKAKMNQVLDSADSPIRSLEYAYTQVDEHIAGLRESLALLDRAALQVSEMGQEYPYYNHKLASERNRALLTEIREILDQRGD